MRLIPAVCAVAVAALTHPVTAQVSRDSIITASANRMVVLAPDRANFYVVVNGYGSSAPTAIVNLDTNVARAAGALSRLGTTVSTERPITLAVGEAPRTSNPYGPDAPPTPYVARAVIRTHVVGVDRLARVFAAVLAAGATSVSSLSFESTAADSARRAQLPSLLTRARGEAEAIAQALGGHLGALVDVTITGGGGYSMSNNLILDARFGSPTTVPETSVPSGVTVRYRLAP